MAEEPQKVEVVSPVPIPVVVKGSKGIEQHQDQATDPSLPAKTTYQQDLTLLGQREINIIWEKTQAVIALIVVVFTMGISAYCSVYKIEIPALIAMAFGTVVGFYFSRTNHAAIGGIGPKAQEEYKGR